MACTLLPQAIAGWRARHPDIKGSLAGWGGEDGTARVLSGEVDCGLAPERDGSAELDARLLLDMAFEAVLSPGHPLANRPQLAWSDLAGYPFISLRGQFTERLLADRGAARRDATLRPEHEVSFLTTALAMVAAGLGVTVCMPYASALVHRHGLLTRPLLGPVLTRRFFIYTRGQRSLSPAAEAFVAFLSDYVGASLPQ
jgi:DNA-binding transcriptional LysR family regulator